MAFVAQPAPAQTRVPDEPALDQYVASLPSAEGEVAPDVSSREPGAPVVPRATRRSLSRSEPGRALLRVAEAPALAAPRAAPGGPSGAAGAAGGRGDESGSVAGALAGAASDGVVLTLLVALGLTAALGAGVRARRARR